jgi:peptidoglycan/xylan/chitin deacetylase (PgdA/CDA1 family)
MKSVAARLRRAIRPLKRLLPSQPGPAILMYHRIATDCFDPWGLNVSPDNLGSQLRWLSESRTVLPLGQFVERHKKRDLPMNAVAITFDDGYASTFTTAALLLEKADLAATIFISPACTESGKEYWWDELERVVLDADVPELELDGRSVKLGNRDPRDGRWNAGDLPKTQRQRAYRSLWTLIRGKGAEQVQSAMSELKRQAGVAADPRDSHRLASTNELMGQHGMEFGSHGLTHASLTGMSCLEQRKEIHASRARLAALTGKAPGAFSYPFGDHDAEAEQLVEEAGFQCACVTGDAFVRPNSKVFALPRIAVGNWSAPDLGRRLAGR